MTELWVTSHVLLWLAVVVQSILIVALMRQVGSLLLRVGSIRAFDAGVGPPIGAEAPWLPPLENGRPNGSERAILLAFLSTSCGGCATLIPSINAVASSYAGSLVTFAVGREDESVLRAWAHKHRLRVPFLSAEAAFDEYKVDGTPYVFVIDKDGRVAARGGVNHMEHLESLLRSCSVPVGAGPQEDQEPELFDGAVVTEGVT